MIITSINNNSKLEINAPFETEKGKLSIVCMEPLSNLTSIISNFDNKPESKGKNEVATTAIPA
jgi:hypothetical protein